MKICEKCTKEISNSNYERHLKVCNGKKKEKFKITDWLQESGMYKCPECGEEKTKKGITGHYFRKHKEEGKKLVLNSIKILNRHNKEIGGWTKGLTKETDERIKKQSETFKKNLADGKFKASQKGVKLTKEQKENLSFHMTRIMQERGNSGYKNIKWYKLKNILNIEYFLRGSYELKVANFLNEKNIVWNRDKILFYNSDIKRRYTPDFYLPEYDIYLETKGYFSEKDKIKMNLVTTQNKVSLFFIFEKELKDLENFFNKILI